MIIYVRENEQFRETRKIGHKKKELRYTKQRQNTVT